MFAEDDLSIAERKDSLGIQSFKFIPPSREIELELEKVRLMGQRPNKEHQLYPLCSYKGICQSSYKDKKS